MWPLVFLPSPCEEHAQLNQDKKLIRICPRVQPGPASPSLDESNYSWHTDPHRWNKMWSEILWVHFLLLLQQIAITLAAESHINVLSHGSEDQTSGLPPGFKRTKSKCQPGGSSWEALGKNLFPSSLMLLIKFSFLKFVRLRFPFPCECQLGAAQLLGVPLWCSHRSLRFQNQQPHVEASHS